MLAGFYARDGLYFERLGDGSIRVKHEHPPCSGQLKICVDLTPEAWASIVASMSLRGETGPTYQAALTFHQRPSS